MDEDSQTTDDEKTEDATPERREEARDEGNVINSLELTSTFVLGALLAFLASYLPTLARRPSSGGASTGSPIVKLLIIVPSCRSWPQSA